MGMMSIGKEMLSREDIEARAREIGEQISKDYEDKELLLVGILRGAVMWMAELMKNITVENTVIDFMAVSSYGSGTKSSGQVRINKDLNEDVVGKDIIIIEDIVDTGTTLNYLKKFLAAREANSVEICAMLDKPARRKTEVDVKYVGFKVENKFIVGHGLNCDQQYRQLPYITCIDNDE